MAAVLDLLRARAAQHVDDMPGAEAFARLQHRGQHGLRLFRAVAKWRLVQAIVAIAAGGRALAEIPKQDQAAALCRLAIADEGAEPAIRAPLMLLAFLLVMDE